MKTIFWFHLKSQGVLQVNNLGVSGSADKGEVRSFWPRKQHQLKKCLKIQLFQNNYALYLAWHDSIMIKGQWSAWQQPFSILCLYSTYYTTVYSITLLNITYYLLTYYWLIKPNSCPKEYGVNFTHLATMSVKNQIAQKMARIISKVYLLCLSSNISRPSQHLNALVWMPGAHYGRQSPG